MKKETTPISFDPIAEGFFRLGLNFEQSLAFLTAMEMDVFTAIGDDYKTAEEIAEYLQCSAPATSRLLNALAAMNLINKNGPKYSNTRNGKEYLVRGGANYIGDLKAFKFILSKWLTLRDTIRNNSPSTPVKLSELSNEVIEGLLSLMNWIANRQAPEFVRFLDISSVTKAIDFGCGSGSFGLELLKININIELVLFDYPEIIPFTEKYLERKGFSGLAKVLAGDLIEADIGKGYDLAIVSNVLRFFSFKDNMKILNKIFDALKRHGRIVLQESLIEPDRINPFFATFESLRLLLLTPNGDLRTETEILFLLKEAWFSNIRIHKTSYGSTIFIGEK
ncbi:MAG: methyltransferase [Candidatus Kapaibacteriota bacterium]